MSEKDYRNRRFHEFVMDQAHRRPWVSRTHESEWLQKATFDLEIEPFEARSLILGAAATRRIFVETEIERLLDDLVTAFADRKGRLGREAFRQLAAAAKRLARGALDEDRAAQLVKEAVARQDLKPRGRGLLRSKRWFRTAGVREAKT